MTSSQPVTPSHRRVKDPSHTRKFVAMSMPDVGMLVCVLLLIPALADLANGGIFAVLALAAPPVFIVLGNWLSR